MSKNTRLSSDASPFRGTDQVNLAVNPSNPQHVVAAHVNFLTETCEASASFDGGTTWSAKSELQVPAPGIGAPFLPSCRVSNHAGESMFQAVAFGSNNTVYATSITPRSNGGVEQGASTLVYKSTDGGLTWSAGRVAMSGGTGGTIETGPYFELPSVLVQPGAGTGGADIVYSIARDDTGSGNSAPPATCVGGAGTTCDQIRIARSLDGGQTWGAPVNVSPPGVPAIDAAHPVIDAAGNLSVTYRTVGAPSPNPATTPTVGEIHFTRSTNQGQTWSAPVVITKVTNMARSSANHSTPLASNASSFPRMAVDRTNGNLYVVYNQMPPGPTAPDGGYQGTDHFIPPDSHVWFQRSLNNGATWSTPKKVNDDTLHPGTRIVQTRHPSVSVAPNGRIDIVWEDRRHWYHGMGDKVCLHTHVFCEDARLGDAYYAYSTNAGGTFTERRVSDHSHNNDVGYDYRFATYWAFGPQAVPLGSDRLLVGWMDSREGSFDSDIQDMYLATVNHSAPSAIPQERVDQPDDVNLSLALSKRTYLGGGEGLMQSGFATRRGTRPVIVNANDAAAALAGSVLARANLAPVLLASTGGVSAAVRNEIARLEPAGAFVIGDAGQLSEQVVADVDASMEQATATVTRIDGGSAAGTAAAIATAMDKRTDAEKAADVPAFDAVMLVNPASPDAYAAAGLAAARRLPILFTGTNDVPVATTAALAALDIDDVLVVGGTDDISTAAENGLVPDTERLGGADQYATSRAVAQESVQRGLPSNMVYVANGSRPMDAALLGFAVGRSTGIMVLSPASVSQTAPGTATAASLTGIDRFVVVEATPPTAPAPPPPPPQIIVQPPPPPPPAAVIQRRTGRISATVTPSRDFRPPYRFRTSGRLTLPSGISRTVGCTGRVSIQIKRGGTTISNRRVSLRRDCTYRSTVSFATSRRFGRTIKRLTFTVRFLGNSRVAPARASARYARIRR